MKPEIYERKIRRKVERGVFEVIKCGLKL